MMKRWVGMRHLRHFWHAYWCYRYAQTWRSLGIGLGIPSEADERHLDDIWEGKA